MSPESTCTLRLIDPGGREHIASVEAHGRGWNEGGFRKRECRITLRWDGGEVSAADWNFFEALRRVREQLTPLGLLPDCYGASRKVILTGMAADMGSGWRIYRAEIGRPLSRDDLVSILDSGPDVEPVSVEEQKAFQEQWRRARTVPPKAEPGPQSTT
jgi:hypothetical protein